MSLKSPATSSPEQAAEATTTALRTDEPFTRKDAAAYRRLVPFQTGLGFSNARRWAEQQFPEDEQ